MANKVLRDLPSRCPPNQSPATLALLWLEHTCVQTLPFELTIWKLFFQPLTSIRFCSVTLRGLPFSDLKHPTPDLALQRSFTCCFLFL